MAHIFHRPSALLFWLFAIILSSAAAPALADATKTVSPVTVTVATVSEQEVAALIEAAGTLEGTERATIAAKVTGMITRMDIKLGQAVKAGDLLVAIGAEEIGARLRVAEAQLAQARRNLEREQNLLAKNASTPETVKSMTDQYAIALAGHREAQTMFGYTTITAPFDGLVTRKHANAGDLATPGMALLQLESSTTFQVRATIPESLLLRVRTGDSLTVRIDGAGLTTRGTVTEIAPAADPQSRTAPLILELPAHADFRSGQFARVLLPGATTKTLMIPDAAVVPAGQMDRVFVVIDDRARLRLVRTGMRHDGLTEILAGLVAGETVATGNHRLLVDGQALRIQP